MKLSDKITKEAKLLTDSAKDVLTKNLIISMNNKSLIISEDQMMKLINLINLSVDDGYQVASRAYQRTVENLLKNG